MGRSFCYSYYSVSLLHIEIISLLIVRTSFKHNYDGSGIDCLHLGICSLAAFAVLPRLFARVSDAASPILQLHIHLWVEVGVT